MRDVEVAYRTFGIDIDCRATDDGLDHLQPDVTDRERSVEQFEFVPGRPAGDIQIGAEAQGMDRLADDAFDRVEACEVDDGNDFAGDIGKTVASAREDFGRSLEVGRKIRREKLLDG
jgi:hypothetical protein